MNEVNEECIWSHSEGQIVEWMSKNCAVGVDVAGQMMTNVLRWTGHMERMESGMMVKNMYKVK